jgi:hypothetical protein
MTPRKSGTNTLLNLGLGAVANLYRFFACSNNVNRACELRGSANWEGETFVNDYEEMVAGRKTKCQDSFSQITPTSFSLTAAISATHGPMKPLIITTYTRR